MIFTSLAIAAAVSLLSPVIIITLIPAVWQSRMAGATSGLTGSLMQTIPMNVAPRSYSLYLEMSPKIFTLLLSFTSFRAPACGISATAKHLRPCP